jgi:hypothetical protein
MIDTTHILYNKFYPLWKKTNDIINAENLRQYLVKLNPQDNSKENELRNDQYFNRSVFYNIPARTLRGFIGSIFRKKPELELPSVLEYMRANVNGEGVSIFQQAQKVCDDVSSKGRAGLFVSFPKTDGSVKNQDIVSGKIVPNITRYKPEQILNWRTETEGSLVKLSLVTLFEEVEKPWEGDKYKTEIVKQIRELYYDFEYDEFNEPIPGTKVYREKIHQLIGGNWTVKSEVVPTDGSGKPWDHIPFYFVGAKNNDTEPDITSLQDIVNISIAHYRNSADFEDSVYFSGQNQPWMSGLTQDHLNMLKENNIYVGSPNLLAVPEGGQFGFAKPEPNPLVRQAMLDKVEMMISLGAKMIEAGSATKTASQYLGEREGQTSEMSLIAENVSSAYNQALKAACKYVNANEEEVFFQLNTDFVNIEASPQELQQIVTGFIQGAVPLGDYVDYMKKKGFFDDEKPVEDYAESLANVGSFGVI